MMCFAQELKWLAVAFTIILSLVVVWLLVCRLFDRMDNLL